MGEIIGNTCMECNVQNFEYDRLQHRARAACLFSRADTRRALFTPWLLVPFRTRSYTKQEMGMHSPARAHHQQFHEHFCL